jgi:hypothetical protein
MILQILGWAFIIYVAISVLIGFHIWGIRRGLRYSISNLNLTEDQAQILDSKLNEGSGKLVVSIKSPSHVMKEPENSLLN